MSPFRQAWPEARPRRRPRSSRSTAETTAPSVAGSFFPLDEDLERLHHPRADPGRRERVAADECVAVARQVLRLRVGGVELHGGNEQQDDDREPGEGDPAGTPDDVAGPAVPEADLAGIRGDDPLRDHPQAVDPVTEPVQEHRRQRDRGEHRDERDQHPAEADRADEGQREQDHAEQADGDGRTRDRHRPAGVGHRLDERRLDVTAVMELLPEAEEHQQRVVDRHAQADEGDQELHDDGHVGDVGERPDEAERGQDRHPRCDQRQRDGRERPEHEQEDEQSADAADQDLDREARAARAADVLLERVAPGEVDGHRGGASSLIAVRTFLMCTFELKPGVPGG